MQIMWYTIPQSPLATAPLMLRIKGAYKEHLLDWTISSNEIVRAWERALTTLAVSLRLRGCNVSSVNIVAI